MNFQNRIKQVDGVPIVGICCLQSFPYLNFIHHSAFDKGPARIKTSVPHYFLIYILVILVSIAVFNIFTNFFELYKVRMAWYFVLGPWLLQGLSSEELLKKSWPQDEISRHSNFMICRSTCSQRAVCNRSLFKFLIETCILSSASSSLSSNHLLLLIT